MRESTEYERAVDELLDVIGIGNCRISDSSDEDTNERLDNYKWWRDDLLSAAERVVRANTLEQLSSRTLRRE